uniref:Ribosomal protein L2 C-terminal domain-containing protein n=1 Tax=Eutreptiella gymnastica TaxID=73025 RepID=A0A7S4CUF3_9EUGL
MRVPWQPNTHKLYRNLPTTLRTWPDHILTRRHCVVLVKTELWKYRPVKHLAVGYPDAGGRNNSGRITVRCRGGGHKVKTITVNFRYSFPEIPKKLLAWEYGRRRSAWLSLVYYANGFFAYHPMIEGLERGTLVHANPDASGGVPRPGEWWQLGDVPAGSMICNVEMRPNGGGQIARAAGTSCTVLNNKPETREKGLVPVLLPSREVRLLAAECWCTVGRIGCADHKFERHGKAGRARWFGRRPKTRGIAMNRVSHPHGGGKGGKKTMKRGGLRPGPWSIYGKLRAHHMKTRKSTKKSWAQIARRRQNSKGLSGAELHSWTKFAYTRREKEQRKKELEETKTQREDRQAVAA